jgi:gas vesicle protein
MKSEQELNLSDSDLGNGDRAGHRAGFAAGLMLGVLLGAGFALLFAPDRGDRTRGRLRQRMRSLGDDAREGIDRAGTRTKKELLRRQRRLRAELRRVRARAREALD